MVPGILLMPAWPAADLHLNMIQTFRLLYYHILPELILN